MLVQQSLVALCVLCCSTAACDTESTSLRVGFAPRYTFETHMVCKGTRGDQLQMTQLTGKRGT